MDQTVERLHRALVDAIRKERGNDFDNPVTVSEIYQKLIPYRTARAAIGVEMNADYEHALLRLLAGEGDLARLEPSEVRDNLRSELNSPNPNVSLFRDYANCDVWVAPSSGYDFDEPDLNETLLEDEADELAFEPEDRAEPRDADPRDVAPAASSPATRSQNCVFCGGDLPSGRPVNFCPHCGNDLTQLPCSKCGETLDPKWRFCANCGAPAAGFDQKAN